MTQTRSLAVLLLALLVGCAGTNADMEKLWPAGARQTLEGPSAALVWRVTPGHQAPADERREDLHGNAYKAGPVVATGSEGLGAAWIDSLRAALLDPGSYLFDLAKACEFTPGFMVQLEGPGGSVDVLLCFSCEELEVHHGGRSAMEDFDPVRDQLWELMRQAYPEDPAFQKR